MIFKPCGMIGVLVEVAAPDVVVLAGNHAAKATEIAFHHVGVFAGVPISCGAACRAVGPARLRMSPVMLDEVGTALRAEMVLR